MFWTGLGLLCVGSGPLLSTLLLAWLGVTDDPDPNPVGYGILASLTLWPAVVLMIVGVALSFSRSSSKR
jgi:hypothetical protein